MCSKYKFVEGTDRMENSEYPGDRQAWGDVNHVRPPSVNSQTVVACRR